MKRKFLPLGVLAAVVIALGGLGALVIGGPWAWSTGSASPGGSLTCSVKASCDGGAGEVEVFRMSSLANAHAALDAAVLAAYRWPPDIADADILSRLLTLNLQRDPA